MTLLFSHLPSVSLGDSELIGSWSAPSDNGAAITDYDVRYCVVSGSNCDSWSDGAFSGAGLTTNITGFTNGTPMVRLSGQIRATNSAGTNAWSPTTSTTVGTPQTPNVTSITGGPGSLMISWTAPVDNGSPITG